MLNFLVAQGATGLEWPIWTHQDKCPTAVYVGGASRYLCRCEEHEKCLGVIAVAEEVHLATSAGLGIEALIEKEKP